MTSGETPEGWASPSGPPSSPGTGAVAGPTSGPETTSWSAWARPESVPTESLDPNSQRPASEPPATPALVVPSQAAPYPYSAVPYSAVPYSAVPYSAMPYSAAPGHGQYGQPMPYPYGQPMVAGPYQTNPWAPVALPAPRRPGGALRWVAGIVAVVFMCSVAAVGGLVGYADYSGALDVSATWKSGALEAPPPAQNAPASEWSSWAKKSVSEALTIQATALRAGDEAGYLSVVDPGNAALVADHKRRFKILKAMGPGKWLQDLAGSLRTAADRSWRADIKISYCFGAATCTSVQLVESSEWEFKDEHLVMTDLDQSDPEWNGPRPWETDELTVATGQRVVMAATKVNAWRLPEAVKSADRAALVADSLAKWEAPPSRYVIFLAGPDDWKKWYGHDQPEWAAAWAVPVSATVTEVVVRTQVVQQRGLETLLTHELTHVTSLAGKRDGADRGAWWLIEGIADYATMIGKPVKDYDAIPPTKNFVKNQWDGNPEVAAPTSSASLEEASARYGVAFLAVRRISDKYTQAKMLEFWGRIVHDNQNIDTASRAALGVPWATVSTDCAKFIRSSVA